MNNPLSRKNSGKSLYVFGFLVLFVSLNQLTTPLLPKVQSPQWSTPQTIPGYESNTWPPILIADQNRTVHAFSSQWVGKEGQEYFKAIVYNQWTLAQGWTSPIDIILSPTKEARLTGAYLDGAGVIHVVFWGGDNTVANIYYSRANSWNANKVQSWSPPVLVAENVGDPEGAVLVENDLGNLLIVYHGKVSGNGVYVIKSEDGGNTWSRPVQIFLTNAIAPLVWNIQVIRDTSGWLHAVWNVYTNSGQGRGIYYTRSKDGIDWSEPVLLAEAQEGYGILTPTIVEYKDSIFVIYNMSGKIKMRRSMDDGLTWSDLVTLFPRHVGVNGSLSAVIDGADTPHLFFGQRITGNPDIHGMWHSIWNNNRWIEPESIIKGPLVEDSVGFKSFGPYEARAVVSQGNAILVTWRTDPGVKGNGVWYSYIALNIPELPVSLPVGQTTQDVALTSTLTGDGTIYPDVVVTENPAVTHLLPANENSPLVEWSSGSLLAIGVVPVIILIFVVIIAKIFRDKPL